MDKVIVKDDRKVLQAMKKIVLGLQHLIAMFGATVLVPILTGFDVSTAIFAAGAGTLIFHFCTKNKVPVFLGSSFAFIPVIQLIGKTEGLEYAQGGIICAGLIYVFISFIINRIGVGKILKFFPPQIVGPMVIVIGLNLLPTALNMAKTNIILSAVTFSTCLILSNFAKGFIKQLSIIISVIIGYILSLCLNVVDTSLISQASIVAVPKFQLPAFSLSAIITICPVVMAVFMEHLGDITTNSQVVGKNFIKDPGLNRTLLGDGLATMFAGFIGGPANTTYGENTGVLAITKNYDPSILRLAAIFAIILSFVGKIGGFLSSIPQAVMGGISVVLFSMISLVGFKTLKNSRTQMNLKDIIIIASILIIGLGSHLGLNLQIKITNQVSLSGLSLAALVGILLNIILVKYEEHVSK